MNCVPGEFGDAVHVEFAHDVASMHFHRGRRDVQLLGNLRRGTSLRHQLQHLALPGAKLRG